MFQNEYLVISTYNYRIGISDTKATFRLHQSVELLFMILILCNLNNGTVIRISDDRLMSFPNVSSESNRIIIMEVFDTIF